MADENEHKKGLMWWVEKLIIPVVITVVGGVLLGLALQKLKLPADNSVQENITSTPTQLFQTPVIDDPNYSLKKEQFIGKFVVQLWHSNVNPDPGPSDIVTIAVAGQPPVEVARVKNVTLLTPLTGNDITGEGNPDVVIQTYSGGAHCCFSTIIYDLGSPLRKVLESPESNCSGELRDIDMDGIYEFVDCDNFFTYAIDYCAYADSPKPPVVFMYNSDKGKYFPDTPEFAFAFVNDLEASTSRAEKAVAAGNLAADKKKCIVLDVVLNHLYTGNEEKAWSEFNRLYQEPDAEEFKKEVESKVNLSQLYVRNYDFDE